MGTRKSLGWAIAVLGLWEAAAPFALGYSASASPLWNAIILGVVLVVVGAWAALTNQESLAKALDWTGALAGVWLVIAPFTIGYSSVGNALWNDVVVGLLALMLSGWAVYVIDHRAAGAHSR